MKEDHRPTIILCFETMVVWTEILYNLSFERLTSSVTSVISLDICTNGFENVHLSCENITKVEKNKCYSKKLY